MTMKLEVIASPMVVHEHFDHGREVDCKINGKWREVVFSNVEKHELEGYGNYVILGFYDGLSDDIIKFKLYNVTLPMRMSS